MDKHGKFDVVTSINALFCILVVVFLLWVVSSTMSMLNTPPPCSNITGCEYYNCMATNTSYINLGNYYANMYSGCLLNESLHKVSGVHE